MVCEILYCTAPESRSCNNAVFELEALRCFAKDSNTVMAMIGEADMMFRKSFLLDGSQELDEYSEELAQDFLDYAERSGKNAVTVW